MERIVRAIRGATTVSENTIEAIEDAVTELLDILEDKNQLDASHIIQAKGFIRFSYDAPTP